MTAKGPTPRLYADGGGVVTRCADPVEARRLLIAEADDGERPDDYPLDKATVCRGRIVNVLPGSWQDGEGWSWQFIPGTGRGSTPAVEWSSR